MNRTIIKKDMQMENTAYVEIIANIKQQIKTAQYKVVIGANRELITLYWNIGKTINERAVWGNKFIENLARDIKSEFPNSTGYSIRNLKYMAKFARIFLEFEIVQHSVAQIVQVPLAQITWYHHISLIDRIKDICEYAWYVEKTAENGWTRNVLVHQIGVSEYKLTRHLPENLKKLLPSIEDIEQKLKKE